MSAGDDRREEQWQEEQLIQFHRVLPVNPVQVQLSK
jgi:hypothetical protein